MIQRFGEVKQIVEIALSRGWKYDLTRCWILVSDGLVKIVWEDGRVAEGKIEYLGLSTLNALSVSTSHNQGWPVTVSGSALND